jgi:hypothetical protein
MGHYTDSLPIVRLLAEPHPDSGTFVASMDI